jgi:myo-inositol-1-phosphate synthase
MVRVVLLGQGYAGSIFAIGIERIKKGEIEPYGVPLANELDEKIENIEIVGSYDVDEEKVGKTVYDVAQNYWEGNIPESLKEIEVKRGVHLGSLKSLPLQAKGLEEEMGLKDAINVLVSEWKEVKAEIIVNVCTTEKAQPFGNKESIIRAVEEERSERLCASQIYAYAASEYAKERSGATFINMIPALIANDPGYIALAEERNLVIFGDDGATGATPLTADLLTHMAQRNRKVLSVAQFNIGGNMDFLALVDEERNKCKELTKSSIVKDILGYDAPHFIKPTGYLEPLGDKKFISLHMEIISFNGAVDEFIVNGRINDSPALAGLLVDLVRLGKIAMRKREFGTVYDVNAFYMKNPGPESAINIPRILAYEKMRKWAELDPKHKV